MPPKRKGREAPPTIALSKKRRVVIMEAVARDRFTGPEQRGRVEAKSLGHVIIELSGDAAILTSEVVRVARRCRPM